MKIIVNRCWGGFGINKQAANMLGIDEWDYDREDERVISAIENGVEIDTDFSKLVVANIPDEATDYYVDDYDGMETIIYVVDGKLHWWPTDY